MATLNHSSPTHGVHTGLKSSCGSAQQRATTPAAATSPAVRPFQDLAAATISPSPTAASPAEITSAP